MFAIADNVILENILRQPIKIRRKDRNHPKKRVSYNKYKKLHAVLFLANISKMEIHIIYRRD
jgi:hypothetical protein